MTDQTVPDRQTKRADELVPGDVIADELYGEPHPVLGAFQYVDELGDAAVLAVCRDERGLVYSRDFGADMGILVERPTDERAARIAEIRQLADWLERNPWVPMPYGIDAWQQVGNEEIRDDLSPAAGLHLVREVADRIGVEADESAHDHTEVRIKFGKRTEYKLLSWHKAGRPGAVDPRDAELERLRAENAALKSAAGFGYSRDMGDEEPTLPVPVSPGRGLHAIDAVSGIAKSGKREHEPELVDGGKLVDEAVSGVHYMEPGPDGVSADRVACGVQVSRLSGPFGLSILPGSVTCLACQEAIAPVGERR